MDRRRARLAELFLWASSTAIVMLLAWIVIFASLFIVEPLSLIWQSSPVVQLILLIVGGTVGGAIVGSVPRSFLQIRASWTKAWFLATIVSWGLVAPVWWVEYQFFGGTNFEIRSQDVVPVILITGIVSGTILGSTQWIIMRRFVKISLLWIPTTTVSWLLGVAVIVFVVPLFDFGIFSDLVALVILGALVGLGAGLAQPKFIDPNAGR